MAKKVLLCASAFGLSAAVWNGSRLMVCRSFEDAPEGHQAFQAFLSTVAGIPVYLTADTVDEDYRFETLPHASGSDRREMLERKLRQLYRSTPFYGAALQDREKDKRRDDRYLLSALTNAEVFAPWLQILMAAKAPVAGVFPLPLITLGVIKPLALSEPNLLIVSKHEAGVRQTFVKDQVFRISRLTPTPLDGQAADVAYAEEIRNTRMYLDALNITHVEDLVTVVILDQDGSLAELGPRIVAGRRNVKCMRVPAGDLMARVGVDRAALEHTRDALPLQLLGLHTPALNLAPPTLTSGYTRYRMSRAVYAGAAVLGFLGAGWMGFNGYQLMDLNQERAEVVAQTQREQARYQEITRTFPPTPADSERLRLTVDVAQRVAGLSRLPDQAYVAVSQGLDANPSITLTSLTWRHSRAAGIDPPQLAQSALLEVELLAPAGDIGTALTAVNKLVKDLGRHEAVASARTTRLPVNLGSGATMRGNTTDPRKAQPVAMQFDVEVVLKPGV
jgi:hypothetical protein